MESPMKKVLRVALVWNGTVMAERSIRQGAVTLGGGRATFHVPVDPTAADDPNGDYALFEVDGETAGIALAPTMTAVVTSNGADTWYDGGQAINVRCGDSGTLRVGQAAVFFQWVHDDARIGAAGALTALDFNLASSTFVAAVGHGVLLACAFLFADLSMSPEALAIQERVVSILVLEPPSAIEELEPVEQVLDESTSSAAGGAAGEFGAQDAEVEESVLPDHEGPMVEALQDTELGMAMESAIGLSGALTSTFGHSDNMASTFGQDFAIAGEGDVFTVGRGVGGMARNGSGPGGGGDGLGRVHGVGEIDTGGGEGIGAGPTRRDAIAPRARMTTGSPRVNGFLSREQIEQVVRRHSRGVRNCYEHALIGAPELRGRVSINWTIGLDGRVLSAAITENSLGDNTIERCILTETRRMRFPEPDGGIVVVTYPFTFRAE